MRQMEWFPVNHAPGLPASPFQAPAILFLRPLKLSRPAARDVRPQVQDQGRTNQAKAHARRDQRNQHRRRKSAKDNQRPAPRRCRSRWSARIESRDARIMVSPEPDGRLVPLGDPHGVGLGSSAVRAFFDRVAPEPVSQRASYLSIVWTETWPRRNLDRSKFL